MNRAIQDQIRPQLFRVEERGHGGSNRVIQPVTPGHAVALLGAPGVDLRRIAREEVLREIMEETLAVWLDLAALHPQLELPQGEAEVESVWEAGLESLFQAGFEQALAAEGIAPDALANELSSSNESAPVARIQAFATLTRRLRRAPVLVIEAMHRLPEAVSERLQGVLRKALDNGEKPRILRLILTSSSDFLSGDILGPGEDDPSSPLYFRTTRYYVAPWALSQLNPLLPLPNGLPEEALELLHELTGGSPGLMELFHSAFCADPQLAKVLLACRETQTDVSDGKHWFYGLVVRLESIARPARQLIREGLGALLSGARGRGRSVATALSELMAGRLVEETVVDPLLPLELAGLARTERLAGVYRYQFCSPIVPELLKGVLPAGKSLREQLDRFNQTFDWSAPVSMEAPAPSNEPQPFSVRSTSNGARMHVVATAPAGTVAVVPVGDGPGGVGQGSGTHDASTGTSDVTGNSGTGNSGTGNSGTGNSGTGNSGTGSSGTGNSGTGSSGTGPAGTPGSSGTGLSTPRPSTGGARAPLQLPTVVKLLQQDQSPESARLLIELLLSIARALSVGRKLGNQALLTPSALEVRWFSKTGETHTGSEGATTATPGTSGTTDPVTVESVVRLLARWDVQLVSSPDGVHDTQHLEAAALFLPGESLARLLASRVEGRSFQPEPGDDAWAMGQFVGLLLALEPDPRLIVGRIEARLSTAEDLAVGVLVRLVRGCLNPVPAKRPKLEEISSGLEQVLQDVHRTSRRLIRYGSYGTMMLVVGLGIWDFFLDTRVDNPNWVYTGIKVVGAAAWAAFYFVAYLIFGRSDKEHFAQQLWSFIIQRRNRVRWLVLPAVVALIFSGFFVYRLTINQGVTLTLAPGQKLEEIKERTLDGDGCSSVVKLTTPLASPTVRLTLDDRDYVFIVDEESPGKPMVRKQLYWPASQVALQREKKWGETLYLFALSEPPPEKSCLPQVTAASGGIPRANTGGGAIPASDPGKTTAATGPAPVAPTNPSAGTGTGSGRSPTDPTPAPATPAPATGTGTGSGSGTAGTLPAPGPAAGGGSGSGTAGTLPAPPSGNPP